MLRSKNREDIAAFIQSYHQEIREAVANNLDSFHMKKKTIDDPEIVDMESVDMFTTPHFQQSRINNEYLIESLIVTYRLVRNKTLAKNKYRPTLATLASGKLSMIPSPKRK